MTKLSELNEYQRGHLAYRLEHNTCCGYCTATSIARGASGDLDIVDIFLRFDRTPRSAKILAKKVVDFVPDKIKLLAFEAFKKMTSVLWRNREQLGTDDCTYLRQVAQKLKWFKGLLEDKAFHEEFVWNVLVPDYHEEVVDMTDRVVDFILVDINSSNLTQTESLEYVQKAIEHAEKFADDLSKNYALNVLAT